MKYKLFIIPVSVLIITVFATAMFLKPNVAETKKDPPVDPDKVFVDLRATTEKEKKLAPTFFELSKTYHQAMNSIFNEGFYELTNNLNPNLKTIDKVADEEKECAPSMAPLNVTTYCLSYRGTKLYINYMKELEGLQGYLTNMSDASLEEAQNTTDYSKFLQADLIMVSRDVNKKVEDDKKYARIAFETTLQAYREFMWSYPLHMAYEKTFKTLAKYRDRLGKIRNQAQVLPLKFIDASTTKCN